ncbi:hypothetical protein B0H14DRAFT_2703649 [Mycena olivaceomarginata]|nr:hypothetical protein B0H14DRAFT_2703649 [Mycena olivaceomarginata]
MAWLEPTPQSQITSDTLQAVLRGRKTWKSRGGEPIWPLDLEAALLEALEKYRPEDCRETLILGRFPGRNRFISDYICDKTGKRRSPKQVGSRRTVAKIRGVRSLLSSPRVILPHLPVRRLIFPFPKPPPCSVSSVATNSATASIVPPPEEWFHPDTLSPRNTIIYIDILQEGQHERSVCGFTSPPWPDVEDGTVIHASNRPRRLKSISPTVSFAAPSPLIAHSRFTVRTGDMVLHTETAPLVLVVDQALQPPVFLYSTQLVPKYWNVIVDSPDTTRFTIFQDVVQTENSCLLFSATYKFSYPRRCGLAADDMTYTPCNQAVSQVDTQCSVYVAPPRTTPLLHSQKTTTMQKCDAASSSFLSFPADLSNYLTPGLSQRSTDFLAMLEEN